MSAAPILVTGAAGGIGSAIAATLAARGLPVIGTDIDAPAGQPIVRAHLPGDLDALLAALPARLGGLVHAAGAIHTHTADAFEPAAFERLFSINVRTPIELTARLAGRLGEGASIVFVGSVAGLRASPSNLLYGASKAALHNAARSFAKALAPRGIRVNTVCPGLIETELTDRTDGDLARLEGTDVAAVRARRRAAIPLARAGRADEIAAAVAYLLLDATFATGTELLIDGGGTL